MGASLKNLPFDTRLSALLRVFYRRTIQMAVMEEDSRSDLEHAVSGISQQQYLNKTESCPNPEPVFGKAKRRTNLWR